MTTIAPSAAPTAIGSVRMKLAAVVRLHGSVERRADEIAGTADGVLATIVKDAA